MALQLTEYKLFADVLNELTFLFFSDLHNYDNDALIKIAMKEKADAILVGGDFVHNFMIYEKGLEFIKRAAEITKVFCALGNHEGSFCGSIRNEITLRGATLLDNDFVDFKGIKIGGLTSGMLGYETPNIPNLSFLTQFSQQKGFKLLLCHHPEYYKKYIKDLPIDLILSGHAHGGQWRFFGRGVLAPGQGLFPKYTSGIHDGRFIISRGIGNATFVPKINNPPEVLKICINRH